MALTEFDIMMVVLTAGYAACIATIMYTLLHFPKSYYVVLLIASTLSMVPYVVLHLVERYIDIPDVTIFVVVYTGKQCVFAANVTLFALSELEFIKVLVSFVPYLRRDAIWSMQVTASVMAIPFLASSFHQLYPMEWGFAISTFRNVWICVLGIYDITQMTTLLLFAFTDMRGSTARFRACYAGAIILAFILFLFGIVIAFVVTDNKSWSLMSDMMVPGFEMCSIFAMMMLRGALKRMETGSSLDGSRQGIALKVVQGFAEDKCEGKATGAGSNRLKVADVREMDTDIVAQSVVENPIVTTVNVSEKVLKTTKE